MQNPPALAGARGRAWRVDRVETCGRRGAPRLVHLSSRDPGERRSLVAVRPFEPLSGLPSRAALRQVTAREAAAAVSLAAAAAHGAFTLRAAERLRGEIHAWQLAPALAIERGHARVLVADAAGMGKTVSAAIAIAQCLDESVDRRCLVIAPAHLLGQWRGELRDRVDIDATVLDAASLRALRPELPAGLSPWSLPGCLIASLDFFKQAHVAASMAPAIWDLLVVDEAHLACGQSERRAAVERIARRSRRVLLLTATPSDGGGERMRALRELGAASRRDRLITLRHVAAGRPRVERVVLVAPARACRMLHDALASYTAWIAAAGRTDGAVPLLCSVLVKRALSSAHAVRLSLERRLALLGRGGTATQPSLFDADEDPAVLGAETGRPIDRERRRIQHLMQLAGDAAREDRRLLALAALIRRSREPALIFSCFRDTADLIFGSLSPRVSARLIHGGLPPAAIDAAIDAFTRGDTRALVATDVASQGLNLHRRCRWVIQYDLPWRPATVEQRIGRVDRLGQRRRVHATFLLDRTSLSSGMQARVRSLADRMHDEEQIGTRRWDVLAAEEARRVRAVGMSETSAAASGRIAGPVTVVEIECAARSGAVVDRRVVAIAAGEQRSLGLAHAIAERRCRRIRRPLAARGARRCERERAVLEAALTECAARGVQAGLFDRRAERADAADSDARRSLTAAAHEAIARHRLDSQIDGVAVRSIASLLFRP